MKHPPLERGQTILVGLHALAAVGFLVIGFVSTGGSDGWADLARFAVAALAGAYFLGASLSWLAARFLTGNTVMRYIIVVVGAPATVLLAILFVRSA